MIDWSLAPEGAESIGLDDFGGYLRWFNGEGQAWLGEGWGVSYANYEVVATRSAQTKTVEDSSQTSCSESEKWTHIDAYGDPCRILIEEKDALGYVVILRQSGHYATPAASSLKPIKPTISESDAWKKICQGWTEDEIRQKYDII